MDFFTHMFVGYLVALWYGYASAGTLPELVLLFAVVLGASPDFDVLLFPLWRRLPWTRHHGITHSLLFMAVAPAVGGAVVSVMFGLPLALLYVVGVLAVGSHLVCDWFTNFEIPLLAPFSGKGYTLGAEHAVNPYLMGWTVLSMMVLWGMRGLTTPATYLLAVATVTSMFLGYCLLRMALKLWLQHRFGVGGTKAKAIATWKLLTWYIQQQDSVSGVRLTRYVRYHVLRKTEEPRFFEVDRFADEAMLQLPVDSPERALLAASSVAQGLFDDLTDMAATVRQETDNWEVTWFRWGALPSPRRTRVSMLVDSEGNVTTGSSELRVWWS